MYKIKPFLLLTGTMVFLTCLLTIAFAPGVQSLDGKNPDQASDTKSNAQDEERTGVTNTEILVGSCSALKGPAGLLGTTTVSGAKLYLNYINDQGGVNGRKIKLLSFSDDYEPTKAIECFNRLLKENVFCAAFFVGTPTAAKHVLMAEAHHVPLIGLFTGAQLLHDPFRKYVISVRASYFDEAKEQVDQLWNAGIKKIGVIYQNDAFGAAVLAGVKLALQKHDAAPIALGSFPRNTFEIDEAIDLVRKANPEAVVMVGSYASLAEIVKRSHKSGWKPLFLTVSFVATEAYIGQAGKDADGTVITQVVPNYDREDLPTVALYRKLLKKYTPAEKPSFVGLEGFVDAMVLVEGLKRAGKDLTRTKLIEAIESIHHMDIGLGPKLKLNYGPDDHKGFDSVYATVIGNGKPVLIKDWKALRSP